jgi:hypothetical protein
MSNWGITTNDKIMYRFKGDEDWEKIFIELRRYAKQEHCEILSEFRGEVNDKPAAIIQVIQRLEEIK